MPATCPHVPVYARTACTPLPSPSACSSVSTILTGFGEGQGLGHVLFINLPTTSLSLLPHSMPTIHCLGAWHMPRPVPSPSPPIYSPPHTPAISCTLCLPAHHPFFLPFICFPLPVPYYLPPSLPTFSACSYFYFKTYTLPCFWQWWMNLCLLRTGEDGGGGDGAGFG